MEMPCEASLSFLKSNILAEFQKTTLINKTKRFVNNSYQLHKIFLIIWGYEKKMSGGFSRIYTEVNKTSDFFTCK